MVTQIRAPVAHPISSTLNARKFEAPMCCHIAVSSLREGRTRQGVADPTFTQHATLTALTNVFGKNVTKQIVVLFFDNVEDMC